MDMLERAIRDTRRFTSAPKGFGVSLTITPPGEESFIIKGLAFAISEGFDENGNSIINSDSHIMFSEDDVIAAGGVTRINGVVSINDWKVSFETKNGSVSAIMSEPKPDHTLGQIKVQLTNHA